MIEQEAAARLSPLSALMLSLDASSTPIYAGAVFLVRPARGKLFTLEYFYRWVEARLGLLSRATDCVRRLTPLRWEWCRDGSFRLDNHVSQVQSDSCIDLERLCFIVGGFFARPMRLDQPLWSMTLINNVSLGWSEATCAVAVRVHRALLAESSITDWMSPILSAPPSVEHCADAEDEDEDGQPPLSLLKRLGMLSIDSLNVARECVAFGGELVSGFMHTWFDRENKRDKAWFSAPISPFEGSATRMRACRFSFVDSDRLDALIETLGSVAHEDVLLTVIAGALRHWMQAEHELPEQPLMALVSGLRAATEPDTGHFTQLSLLSLATLIENPLDRLSAIRIERHDAGQQFRRMNIEGIMANAPLPVIRGAASALKTLIDNGVTKKPLSNLMVHFESDGCSNCDTADGHQWLEQWSVPLIWPGNQLAFSVQRSNGSIVIGLMGSSLTMDQLKAIEDGLMFSLHQLEKVAQRTPSSTVTKLLQPVCGWGQLDRSLRLIEGLVGQSTETEHSSTKESVRL